MLSDRIGCPALEPQVTEGGLRGHNGTMWIVDTGIPDRWLDLTYLRNMLLLGAIRILLHLLACE